MARTRWFMLVFILPCLLLIGCHSQLIVDPKTCSTCITDRDITTTVQVRIAAQPGLGDQGITVSTYERTVTLTGTVNNPTQRNVAVLIAKSVPGVKRVKSYLTIIRTEG